MKNPLGGFFVPGRHYLIHPTPQNQKNRKITQTKKRVKNNGFDKNGGHHELRLEKLRKMHWFKLILGRKCHHQPYLEK